MVLSEREKTLQRMHQLIALAALSGACKREPTESDAGYAVVDPIPTPALDSGPIVPIAIEAGPAPDGGKTDGGKHAIRIDPIDIKHSATPPSTAYGVVDPMPSPYIKR